MTHRVITGLGIAALTLLAAGPAFALGPQEFPASETTGTAGSIPVGPLTVYPGATLAQGYDDNLYFSPSHTKSSTFTNLNAYARAEVNSGPNKFSATASIDHRQFWSNSNNNYTIYSLIGNSDLVFDGRTGLKLRAEFRHGVDPIGTTDRPLTNTPDTYNNYGLDGIFHYGAPGAQGRIEIDAGAFARRYTNNHDTTDDANRNTWQVGGTFFWRVMPRTEVLIQARHTDIHYTDPTPPSQSSTENRYYLGLKWEATAKTTGTLKLGYLTKDFNSSAYKDYGNFAWEAGVRWSPLTYSVFDFITSKQTSEATGVGGAIVSNNYGVTWSHAWNSRLSTTALAGYRKDDFLDSGGSSGSGIPERKDGTTAFGARVRYDFRRWLYFGAEATHADRNSNRDIYDYKRNLYMLTVGATL